MIMKMFRSVVSAAIVAAAVLSASTSRAAIYTFDANLDGPSESPPNASPGTGFATVTFDTTLNLMNVNLSFSGLLGTTTASHIHSATAAPGTGAAGVATTTPYFAGFPLGVTSGSYNNTLDMTLASSYNPAFVTANGGTTAGAEAALLSGLLADKAYLNIHTTVFPGGEITGFLTLVPEPGVVTLLALGAAIPVVWRNRKKLRR
jgi:CHRD domain